MGPQIMLAPPPINPKAKQIFSYKVLQLDISNFKSTGGVRLI